MGKLIGKLLHGEAFPGKVGNDKEHFLEAIQSEFGYILVFWDVPQHLCSNNEYGQDCGLKAVLRDFYSERIRDKSYAFPPSAPRELTGVNYSACDENWGRSCFNCGTYPASVGVPIPEESGMLDRYLPKMASLPGAFCRCYKAGEWLSSESCLASSGMIHQPEKLKTSCKFENPTEINNCNEESIEW
eukprot:CAMPEP_0185260122 /NCGR_PEP_ID=MMETSP1359-20130426/8758_1 /TAXON_ID=552665 /ORGANISM="Bigelowiella longifila, Strain CCMP242" /LENGTH=186 /DNA_ID=CAMNT_0027846251 /DNA_START=328 /DNA_END=885 /DNA_ORIENTATION=-